MPVVGSNALHVNGIDCFAYLDSLRVCVVESPPDTHTLFKHVLQYMVYVV